MDVKVSTLGATQENSTLQNTEESTIIEQATPNLESGEGQSKPADTSHTEVIEGQGLDANSEKIVVPEATQTLAQAAPIVEAEENETTFSLNFDDEAKPTAATDTKPAAQITSWQDAIKGVDRKEVAKALGFTDFALEMDEHISKGGNAVDYLNAKAIDYTKVPDSDLVKDQLRKELPNATSQQLDLLIAKRYNQSELAEEDDREYGSLQMQMDANKIRQERIAKQQSFKIPEAPINKNQAEWEQQQQQLATEAAQRAQQQTDFIINHEAIQDLISNKRVSVDLGDGNKPFNFKVDDKTASYIVKAITDGETWGKIVNNEKGEPNVNLLKKLVVHAMNPNYDKDLFESGRMAGIRSKVEESQNVRKPTGAPVVDMKPQGFKVKGTSTIGSHS